MSNKFLQMSNSSQLDTIRRVVMMYDNFPASWNNLNFVHAFSIMFYYKGPFGPLLAPPEGLRAPELLGVNPRDRPQESGGDSKVI